MIRLLSGLISLMILFFSAINIYADTYLYGFSGNVADTVLAYDTTTGALVNTISAGLQANSGIAFGSDGYLYGLDSYGRYRAVDVTTNTIVREVETAFTHSGTPLTFGLGGYLYGFSGITSDTVLAYDTTTGSLVNTISVGLQANSGIVFGPNGYLYGLDTYGSFRAVDVSTNTIVNEFSTDFTHSGTPLTISPTVVPEPLSFILFITGGVTLLGRRFIRRHNKSLE